jgi:hypothetical protein
MALTAQCLCGNHIQAGPRRRRMGRPPLLPDLWHEPVLGNRRPSVPPVRLYCTEIIHRALRFADLPGAKLAVPFETLPSLSVAPPKRDSWWNLPPNKGGSFVVADGFIAYSHYLYSNDPPAPLAVARQRADLIRPIQHEWRRTRDNLVAVLRRLRPPAR